MSAYSLDDERKIRVGRLVADWTKSGLLSEEQRDKILPELQVELRRTNLFLRLVLFIFAMLIIQSALGILAITIAVSGQTAGAVLCAIGAVGAFWLAGFLVNRFRLYRFGIEEAAAVAAIGLMGAAAALGWSEIAHGIENTIFAAGLVAAAAVAVAVFARFGYLYAAIAAMACAAALPFLFGDSEIVHRVTAIAILALIAATAWTQRTKYGDDYPGDTYGLIEAAAWIGIYALINLLSFGKIDRSEWFYWVTYAGIWIVPLLALWVSIRSRQRMLLDVSVLMLLATLMSNKAYLGTPRYAWDPIVFGLLLMGSAIAIKRWLASGENGERHGFTAARILASDKAKVGVFGMASLAHPAATAQPGSAPADPMGGGRSGGAGAGGSF
ncbi:MAG: hypothetical protein Q7R30_01215 [Acidobacteriota bacterium]|nr:hypothetical protein [Acidobacteriota bacterium]